uniref:Endomembrane protein 70like protein putative n=1 Tax=Albugo laibachii Nc14 TaxID=890382 RepID=F0W0R8_9STRA|nr:endomembrane protein 70like protein putative [Albugo laibachii Nc14]|eukprot:CCA14642.1 endomembrane protein 70like protein putative [Albugo laibachii Nc14]
MAETSITRLKYAYLILTTIFHAASRQLKASQPIMILQSHSSSILFRPNSRPSLLHNLNSKYFLREALIASDLPPKATDTIGNLTWKEWCCIWLPFPQSILVSWCYPDIVREENVTFMHFGRYNLKHLSMNVYRRSNVTNAPILVYIHGGGWMTGSREHPPYSFLYQIAMLGWVVCVLDYRLSPMVKFPTQLIDLKHRIAFLRRYGAARFQANPDYIVAPGESAGGHFAALVTLTSGNTMYQPGFDDVDTSFKACIDLFGVHDFADRHGLYYKRIREHRFTEGLETFIM